MRSAVLVTFWISGLACCSASSSIATTLVTRPHCCGVIVMWEMSSHSIRGDDDELLVSTISVDMKNSHSGLFCSLCGRYTVSSVSGEVLHGISNAVQVDTSTSIRTMRIRERGCYPVYV